MGNCQCACMHGIEIIHYIGKNILIPFYYKRYSQTIYKNFIVANIIKNDAYNNPFYGYIEKGTVKDGYIYFAVPFNVETIYLVSNYEELAFSFNLK